MQHMRLARAVIAAAALSLSVGWARSPLGLMLQDHFGVAVVEEATNSEGTLFVLLEGIPRGKSYGDVEEAAEAFVRELVLEVAVIVYPATSPRGAAETHEATTVRKPEGGAPVAATQGWSDLVSASGGAAGSGALSNHGLTYRHGSSNFLVTRPPSLDATTQQTLAPAAELSSLGLFLQERFEAVVLEEATNPQGTLFILLDELPRQPTSFTVGGAAAGYLNGQPLRMAVVVYPITSGLVGFGTHTATVVTKNSAGRAMATAKSWVAHVAAAEAAGPVSGLKNVGLDFTFGETRFLAAPPVPPASPPVATPIVPGSRSTFGSASTNPRNGCVLSSTSSGNTLNCYTDGRLTYRSVCTIDSNFNVTCRSDSY